MYIFERPVCSAGEGEGKREGRKGTEGMRDKLSRDKFLVRALNGRAHAPEPGNKEKASAVTGIVTEALSCWSKL